MLNKCIFMGRLVSDPELQQTPNGQDVCNFTLAIDRDYKPQDGDREADFIDFVAWRATAGFVSKYFAKGQMMAVEGRLQIRKWVDKEGNNRRSSEIVVENVYFCGGKQNFEVNGPSDRVGGASAAATSAPVSPAIPNGGNDDDLPF